MFDLAPKMNEHNKETTHTTQGWCEWPSSHIGVRSEFDTQVRENGTCAQGKKQGTRRNHVF